MKINGKIITPSQSQYKAISHTTGPLMILAGAGTGKTLLAIAAGLHQVGDTHMYNRLLISRPVIPMGRDIGYLPEERGLYKNSKALDVYSPKDNKNRFKYKISDFKINQPSLSQGDIWSYEANSARFSSYEIILEIDLYNTNEEVIETLEFKRKVFSPAKFIYNKTIIVI